MSKFGLASAFGVVLVLSGWTGRSHAVTVEDFGVGSFAVLDRLFPDQAVTVDGDWPAPAKLHLIGALSRAAVQRSTRPADINEYSIRGLLKIYPGEQFGSSLTETHVPNPAAIWGAGISGDRILEVTIKTDASEDQMTAYLEQILPERLVRDEAELLRWRRMVAQAYRPTICGSIMSLFRPH